MFLHKDNITICCCLPCTFVLPLTEVPEYNRLDRKLLEYRTIKENEAFINDELLRLQKQRADTKTQLTYSKNTITIPLTATATAMAAMAAKMLTPSDSSSNPLIKQQAIAEKNLLQSDVEEWRADQCVHLFSTLFKRLLSAQERFAIHRTFGQYGPFKEKMVRSVIGRLLGESYPTSDLSGYLDAIRIASMIKKEENDNAKND